MTHWDFWSSPLYWVVMATISVVVLAIGAFVVHVGWIWIFS